MDVRRYIDFLILLIPTPLVSVLFLQQHPYFLFFFWVFFVLYIYNIMVTFPLMTVTAYNIIVSAYVRIAYTMFSMLHMYADDDTRVHLKEIPNVEGSDYINASFVEVKSTLKSIFALSALTLGCACAQ